MKTLVDGIDTFNQHVERLEQVVLSTPSLEQYVESMVNLSKNFSDRWKNFILLHYKYAKRDKVSEILNIIDKFPEFIFAMYVSKAYAYNDKDAFKAMKKSMKDKFNLIFADRFFTKKDKIVGISGINPKDVVELVKTADGYLLDDDFFRKWSVTYKCKDYCLLTAMDNTSRTLNLPYDFPIMYKKTDVDKKKKCPIPDSHWDKLYTTRMVCS